MKNLLVVLLFISFFQVNAQDSASHKRRWFLTSSLGFSENQVGGSMPDFIEKFSREFGTPMPQQNNGGGLQVSLTVQKNISDLFYLKSGFVLAEKKVNPEEQAYPLYKDSLHTYYLSIPLLIGIQAPLDAKKTVHIFLKLVSWEILR